MNSLSTLVLLAAPNKPYTCNRLLGLRKATSLTSTYATDSRGLGELPHEKVGHANRLVGQGLICVFD